MNVQVKTVIGVLITGLLLPLLVWWLTREGGPLYLLFNPPSGPPGSPSRPPIFASPSTGFPDLVRESKIEMQRSNLRFWLDCERRSGAASCAQSFGSFERRREDCIRELDAATCDRIIQEERAQGMSSTTGAADPWASRASKSSRRTFVT